MSVASEAKADSTSSRIDNLIPLLEFTAEAASTLRDRCRDAVAGKVSQGGKIDGEALEREQHAAHGLAWIATYAEALNQVASYARRMSDEGRFGEMEALLAQIGAAEYAAQLYGGVVMSQGEIARTHELGVSEKDQTAFLNANVRDLISSTTPAHPRPRHRADPRLTRRRGLRRYRPRRDGFGHARGDAPLLGS